MKITLVSGKGGAGKTTITVLLALALKQAGHTVSIEDRDPQRTLTRWLAFSGHEFSERGSFHLIDTPPRLDSPVVTSAIQESNAVIVPCRPGLYDMFTAQDTASLIKQIGAEQKSRILFNAIRQGTALSKDLSTTADNIGLSPISPILALRECYQHASLEGWSRLTPKGKQEVVDVTHATLILGAGNK